MPNRENQPLNSYGGVVIECVNNSAAIHTAMAISFSFHTTFPLSIRRWLIMTARHSLRRSRRFRAMRMRWRETARLTDVRIGLDEDRVGQLDARLYFLGEQLSAAPTVSVTFFKPDTQKDGGSYETVTSIEKSSTWFGKSLTCGMDRKYRLWIFTKSKANCSLHMKNTDSFAQHKTAVSARLTEAAVLCCVYFLGGRKSQWAAFMPFASFRIAYAYVAILNGQ